MIGDGGFLPKINVKTKTRSSVYAAFRFDPSKSHALFAGLLPRGASLTISGGKDTAWDFAYQRG